MSTADERRVKLITISDDPGFPWQLLRAAADYLEQRNILYVDSITFEESPYGGSYVHLVVRDE